MRVNAFHKREKTLRENEFFSNTRGPQTSEEPQVEKQGGGGGDINGERSRQRIGGKEGKRESPNERDREE